MSLDAIGIVSRNIKDSVRFYEILGVHLKEAGSSDHLEADTPNGIRVMIDSVDLIQKINPEWKSNQGSGIVLCFKKDTPEEVDQLYAKIIEAGFKSAKKPWDAFWGQRYASVQDPDGNQIDLFATLPSA